MNVRFVQAAMLGLVSSVLLISCGGSPAVDSKPSSSTSSPGSAKLSGIVNVAYAGSLIGAMVQQIAPTFRSATGITVNGLPGGSSGLANQIKSGTTAVDVFISAAPSVNDALMGRANGNLATWYATLGNAPLVIGYSPSSRFVADLKSKPWNQVMRKPGFLLGRTDPAIDPKGVLVLKLLAAEATRIRNPLLSEEILGTPENSNQVYPEETLVARLQSGQLDAGFFYSNEAALARIPTIPTGLDFGAEFTVTILTHAENRPQAVAFVRYLYSSKGQAILRRAGLNTVTPKVTGDVLSEPPGLGVK